jgi:hypothetical protein
MNIQREASHPLFYRVGSRRMRRRVVVAMYAGWVVIATIVLLRSFTSPGWFWAMELITLPSTLFQIIWFVWLGRTYVNAPVLADEELDERLLQVKNRAYRRAYRVLAPVAISVWLLSLFALAWQPNDHGKVMATMLVMGVALVAGTLPTAIVAWQEPDPEPLAG